MPLARKIFLASAGVLALLAGAAGWSLSTVNRLVTAQQAIADRAVPAARLEHQLPDALSRLERLEARHLILRDRALVTLWEGHAAGVADDLGRLGALVDSAPERRAHAEAAAAFGRYRAAAERARALAARGDAAAARRVSEGEARREIRRTGIALAALTTATDIALARARAEAAALERRTWTGVVTALAASLGAGLLMSFGLAMRMTRSLRRLTAAATALGTAAAGPPVPVEGRDEIAELAETFNRMAERLLELDRLKEEFFSHISHDLRNPLTAMRGGAQLMLSGRTGPLTARQQRMLEVVDGSAARMLGMVNEILEFTRLRAGRITLDPRPVDLAAVAARAVDELAPRAEEKRITLRSIPGPDPVLVRGDAGALLRVVVNLVGNALAFTPEGGAVTVRFAEDAGTVALAVEDTGEGIPPEALGGIFDPYRQAHAGRGGSGLGLAVVRALAEAHGGSVGVASTPGKGSVFTVRLPAEPAPAPVLAPAPPPPTERHEVAAA